MNLIEILKDVPKGTKLYSPAFDNVKFKCIYNGGIKVEDICGIERLFYINGNFYMDGECMLFPSKDNRDWNNFCICPFKKGDFIVKENQDGKKFIAIFSHFGGHCEYTTNYLCLLRPDGELKPKLDFGIGNIQEARLATDSEKKELLDAIIRNGYYWDECSMTLKELKLKFKVGDTIHIEGSPLNHTIKSIEQDRYICENGYFLRFVDQNDWNIVKFDITTLNHFDKVIVRDYDSDEWSCNFYSHYSKEGVYRYMCSGNGYIQCIPYNDETKHLVSTKQECPEYYKNW